MREIPLSIALTGLITCGTQYHTEKSNRPFRKIGAYLRTRTGWRRHCFRSISSCGRKSGGFCVPLSAVFLAGGSSGRGHCFRSISSSGRRSGRFCSISLRGAFLTGSSCSSWMGAWRGGFCAFCRSGCFCVPLCGVFLAGGSSGRRQRFRSVSSCGRRNRGLGARWSRDGL